MSLFAFIITTVKFQIKSSSENFCLLNELFITIYSRVRTDSYGGRYAIKKTAQVADSEEKLCRLASEFGRVCERKKLRVNVGKSKVMRCSRYQIWVKCMRD